MAKQLLVPDADAPLLSPTEAAAYVRFAVSRVYAACASGALRHVKLEHSMIRIRREWLDAWMAEREAAA